MPYYTTLIIDLQFHPYVDSDVAMSHSPHYKSSQPPFTSSDRTHRERRTFVRLFPLASRLCKRDGPETCRHDTTRHPRLHRTDITSDTFRDTVSASQVKFSKKKRKKERKKERGRYHIPSDRDTAPAVVEKTPQTAWCCHTRFPGPKGRRITAHFCRSALLVAHALKARRRGGLSVVVLGNEGRRRRAVRCLGVPNSMMWLPAGGHIKSSHFAYCMSKEERR
ncbi:hypothetical protein SODALDRAFT_135052 [Sodiomyces alkalinus F11]|uniref:Uncharacterized protein n=1 Tax=Sodiomyces alkalinus (strain CBS 110278 / VKM F-3762 / F11) TaxID=1314773 RepID=A0A3N2PYR4_SODAK|nr:hypothetical protein SODALDRAFT_135052 [Sodiomyces alkalinus F11]ROT39660.1 hypothetical protein SODALDRAFT_135052 [Sodiomyces alkalinus F11]